MKRLERELKEAGLPPAVGQRVADLIKAQGVATREAVEIAMRDPANWQGYESWA